MEKKTHHKAVPAAALEGEKCQRFTRTLAKICKVLFTGLFLFGSVAVSLSILILTSPPADETATYSAMCMHTIGGGPVGPRGGLLQFNPRCIQELEEYFAWSYYAEVHRVAHEAIAYYRQQVTQQQTSQETIGATSYRGTVVFDIDETALSNADGFFDEYQYPLTRLLHRLFGRTDSSETQCVRPWTLDFVPQTSQQPPALQRPSLVRLEGVQEVQRQGSVAARARRMEQVEGGAAELRMRPLQGGLRVQMHEGQQMQQVQQRRRPLCSARAVRPVRDLYNFLLDSNYTVVFLTGRSEDARQETEDNLEAAGYGRQCGQEEQKLLPAPQHRRLLRTSAQSSTHAGPRRCYSALLMRREGDTRLASVFKPEARQQLLAAAAGGVVLAGSIGDQFSDLVGMPVAEANWKLPNPVYTLL